MDSYMTSYFKCSASSVPTGTTNSKDLLIPHSSFPRYGYIPEKKAWWCCTPVSLKEEFLVNMFCWKVACLFMASSGDSREGTQISGCGCSYFTVFCSCYSYIDKQLGREQSGFYFMISRKRKQCVFPMRKWWAQASWAGNENKEHSHECSLEQHPSV